MDITGVLALSEMVGINRSTRQMVSLSTYLRRGILREETMISGTKSSAEISGRSSWRIDEPLVALSVLLMVTAVLRFTLLPHRSLWLDEAQTGMIVSQTTLADFVRQCRYDVSPPLYYYLAWAWAAVSGVSDRALRILPAALGAATPLVALVPRRLISRATRFTWSALLACWIPGILLSLEARWFALALFVGVANAAAFGLVMRSPSLRTASMWTVVSSLLILTHFYGAILVGLQGLVYLGVHRWRAVRTWPAALAFAPALWSIYVRVGSVATFVAPGTSWIPLVRTFDLYGIVSFVFGAPLVLIGLAAWLVSMTLLRWRTRVAVPGEAVEKDPHLWVVPACAAAATITAVAVGYIRPTFVARYLIPFVPGVMLGLAMLATNVYGRIRLAVPTLTAIFFGCCLVWAYSVASQGMYVFSYERGSMALVATRPTRLVFLWDNPMRPDPNQLAALGGFFFKRAGWPVPVDPVVLPPGADPNPILLREAAGAGSAILWIYDRGVAGTAANRFRPRISRQDPNWRCHNYGSWQFGVIACRRPSEVKPR